MHTCSIFFSLNTEVAIRDHITSKLLFSYKFFLQRATLRCLFWCNLYFLCEKTVNVKCSPFRLLLPQSVVAIDVVLIVLWRRDYFRRPWRPSGAFVCCPFRRWFTRKVHKSMEVRMHTKSWIIINNCPPTGPVCLRLNDSRFMQVALRR